MKFNILVVTFYACAWADEQQAAHDGSKLFAEGQEKAQALSKKLARRNLSLEKGDQLPVKLQEDVDEVVDLFTQAADAGFAEAQHALGGMYNMGYMVKEKDDSLSAKYFSLAADQGKLESITNLGTMYKDGVGVEHDIIQAIDLYEKAFEGGHSLAAYNLAAIHANGVGGLTKDLFKARALLAAIPDFQGASEAMAQIDKMIQQEAGEL